MLEGIITSKTRVKLLMRFFLNPHATSYLRELADQFGVSTNGIREELMQMVQSKLLTSHKEGRQVIYQANTAHPLFHELHSMVQKSLGMDRILESIIERLGDIEEAYLIDDYAEGRDTGIIDLLLIGNVNTYHLSDLSKKTERYIDRKIRSLVLTREEFEQMGPKLRNRPNLLIWRKDIAKGP
ncbi:winged helix-turn-helix domain-containing protein [Desulfoferrobacter suflitae]|uniref:winged helix-turn-helix domain-containing protein n=1 Tax=Desulfoferrobacter suflitae TaxID=2865782 RepID=UPI002164C7B4|nr:winged helix-turn-helix domain-containing protein [Desulfoferrobacter suflitae]MCK8600201.1 winged helix-turn-helix domain-containing protein [Desulfoferrobacter suflitae]